MVSILVQSLFAQTPRRRGASRANSTPTSLLETV